MSWNFSITGAEKQAVKAKIEAQEYCPPALRSALAALVDNLSLDAGPNVAPFGIYVDTNGHVDSYNGYGTFKVSRVTRAE